MHARGSRHLAGFAYYALALVAAVVQGETFLRGAAAFGTETAVGCVLGLLLLLVPYGAVPVPVAAVTFYGAASTLHLPWWQAAATTAPAVAMVLLTAFAGESLSFPGSKSTPRPAP